MAAGSSGDDFEPLFSSPRVSELLASQNLSIKDVLTGKFAPLLV
jgi:hypothetical protein